MKKLIVVLTVLFFSYTGVAFAAVDINGYRPTVNVLNNQVDCDADGEVLLIARSNRRGFAISNHSGDYVYLGKAFGLTTLIGFELPDGFSITDESIHGFSGTLSCITDSGTLTVSVIEFLW